MSEGDIISISDTESSRHSFILVQKESREKPSSDDAQSKIFTSSSKSAEQCSLTWSQKPPFKYLDSESFLSPSSRAKVSTWLYGHSQNISDNHQVYTDNKSAILIRQDYKKPQTVNNSTATLRRDSFNGDPTAYNDESGLASQTIHSSKESVKDLDSKSTSNQDLNACDTLSEALSTNTNSKSISSPLNVDVPNKIELCAYLKLMNMNPVDGKVTGCKQNRRSSRVKNLAIMSEKRALERELNSNDKKGEKKKSINGSDQDVKSCTGSESSKESKESSKLSNQTFSSASTKRSSDKTNLSSTKTAVEESKAGNDLCVPSDNKQHSTRTKYLQVPEISTTSTTKMMPETAKYEETNKFVTKKLQVNLRNVSIMDNSKRSAAVITETSLKKLYVNMDAIKINNKYDKLQTIKDSLLKYITNTPSMDFEDSFKKIISIDEVNKHLQEKKNHLNVKNQRTKTPVPKKAPKPKQNTTKNITKSAKSKTKLNRFPKSRLRSLHDKLQEKRTLKKKDSKKKPTKLKKIFRLYSPRRNLLKLRSRGKLKEIGIKSVLLKHDKKKKKRFVAKPTEITPKQLDKEFREAVLIQQNPTVECKAVEEPKLSSPECSPPKILKLKSELDLLKNLTPEHRKALFESKKFVNMKAKANVAAEVIAVRKEEKLDETVSDIKVDVETRVIVDKTAEIVDETSENVDETSEIVDEIAGNCDSTFTLEKLQQTDQEISEPEDLEVPIVMTSNHILARTGKPVNVLEVLKKAIGQMLEEDSQTSLSSKTSDTSTTFQSITSDSESVRSPAKEPTDDHLENDNSMNEELLDSRNSVEDNEQLSEGEEDCEYQPEVVDISDIERTQVNCVQTIGEPETGVKSLHQCFTKPRKKQKCKGEEYRSNQKWDDLLTVMERLPKSGRKTGKSYSIELSSRNGAVMGAYYLDYNLVIVQELLISFWGQTSLGNVLGAQDMWMPKGDTKRIVLGNGCIHKESSESVMVLDTSIAYVELWTKEHKSDKRERPVADIFVTIYLRLNATGPDKKVLQLENIHGYASDVQYIVLKNSPYIIVSWNTITDRLTSTVVHKYQLSGDYKTVIAIVALQQAGHYITSLHNIEDSDTLIMGCGEDKITLWHEEGGYIVATLDLMAIAQQPRTLWAKADRGFIFTLHNYNDGYFHLIATNSFDYSWKQLQMYKQEAEFENLLGICVENGLVVAFYDTGILCWSAESGEVIVDIPSETSIFLPFGKHIVLLVKNQVHVRHALEYLITIDDS